MSSIVLASNNAGKLKEFQELLHPTGFVVQPQAALQVPECDEPYGTFIENALHKARHASQHTGLPAMADDSGVCVTALNGAPGVYSARFAKMAEQGSGDAANNRLLLQRMHSCDDRSAYYYAVIVLVRSPADPQPIIAEGIWHGTILESPRGEGGFGYDPLFYLPHLQKTAAELTSQEKNAVSHRGQALRALLSKLQPQTSL